MCLAIPVRVMEVSGDTATVEIEGVRREVNVMLVPDIKVGEYAVVHAGFAIGKLDEQEALESLRTIREMLDSSQDGGP
ncbi:MAG: HypC/HybG/HupF family hydrogenase formation chaperone [Candidatus Eiseniibacteriota bacterium]|nr:MAG: HypC/HybG/HupF family hydrogenase formation chaperone [Candidatus Eisenbacteria bacterium]